MYVVYTRVLYLEVQQFYHLLQILYLWYKFNYYDRYFIFDGEQNKCNSL